VEALRWESFVQTQRHLSSVAERSAQLHPSFKRAATSSKAKKNITAPQTQAETAVPTDLRICLFTLTADHAGPSPLVRPGNLKLFIASASTRTGEVHRSGHGCRGCIGP